ncbi:hypothetical protein [Sinomonas sp.]|uniref:hypothetical protein n=1 Tax=Sinomonas sp. TaxID=1914986 RepID=UPI002FE275F9
MPSHVPAQAPSTVGTLARLSGPQKVIVQGAGGEIHGYAVEADGERILVLWALPSGRCRRKSVSREDVYLPSRSRPWSGLAIAPEQLRACSRGIR